jgi:hypothetical protein
LECFQGFSLRLCPRGSTPLPPFRLLSSSSFQCTWLVADWSPHPLMGVCCACVVCLVQRGAPPLLVPLLHRRRRVALVYATRHAFFATSASAAAAAAAPPPCCHAATAAVLLPLPRYRRRAISANAAASPTLLSMVGCGAVSARWFRIVVVVLLYS